jgi:hypothetical protein
MEEWHWHSIVFSNHVWVTDFLDTMNGKMEFTTMQIIGSRSQGYRIFYFGEVLDNG